MSSGRVCRSLRPMEALIQSSAVYISSPFGSSPEGLVYSSRSEYPTDQDSSCQVPTRSFLLIMRSLPLLPTFHRRLRRLRQSARIHRHDPKMDSPQPAVEPHPAGACNASKWGACDRSEAMSRRVRSAQGKWPEDCYYRSTTGEVS